MGKAGHNRGQRQLIGPKKKIAFVCSGGATKAGAFHLGVALALQEQGFSFRGGLNRDPSHSEPPHPMEISTYVGSSAGSIISSYLAAGYSLETIFNSFLSKKPVDDRTPELPPLTYQKMFKFSTQSAKEQFRQILLVKNILKNIASGNFGALLQLNWLKFAGIFTTEGIEAYLKNEVLPSNYFKDYLADLFIVATQLNHSRKVVFGKYNYQPPETDLSCQYNNDALISEACAASTALPPVYTPYTIQGTDYIDGEIRDTLSTHVAIDAGADLVIASFTHQPYHYHKAIGSLTQVGLPSILIQSIYLLIEQKIKHHIRKKTAEREAIHAVSRYCKQNGIDEKHRRRICEILEAELHHRMNVDTIYIHPNPKDYQMFFREHFTLSSQKMSEMVRSGFKATIDVLRKYDFADRTETETPKVTSVR